MHTIRMWNRNTNPWAGSPVGKFFSRSKRALLKEGFTIPFSKIYQPIEITSVSLFAEHP